MYLFVYFGLLITELKCVKVNTIKVYVTLKYNIGVWKLILLKIPNINYISS